MWWTQEMGDTRRHVAAQTSTPKSGDERRCACAASQRPRGGSDDEERDHDGIGEHAVREPVEDAPEILVVDDGEVAGATGLEDGLCPVGPRRGR